MDKMTPQEVDLTDELQYAYGHLADRVSELLKNAAWCSDESVQIPREYLLACRAAVHEIKRIRIMLDILKGRVTQTLSSDGEGEQQ